MHLNGIDILDAALGSGHADIGLMLNNLGEFYRRRRRFGEAETMFQRALRIEEERLGKLHPYVLQTLFNYSRLLRDTKRKKEAAEMENRVRALVAVRVKEYPAEGLTVDFRSLARTNNR